jgi:hypothetical protein
MTTRLFCPRRWLWTAPHGDIPILPTLCGLHPRTRFFLGALLLVFMSLGQAVRALPVPPIQRPVRDEVRLLDMTAAAQVRQICNDLERRTDAELVVLIIRSTRGENHHEFALKTFNSWGVGSGGRHDGVLILFAIDDRRVEIVPGIRYKKLFTQQASTDLLTTHVVPLMKAGKAADGVISAAREVAEHGHPVRGASRACTSRIIRSRPPRPRRHLPRQPVGRHPRPVVTRPRLTRRRHGHLVSDRARPVRGLFARLDRSWLRLFPFRVFAGRVDDAEGYDVAVSSFSGRSDWSSLPTGPSISPCTGSTNVLSFFGGLVRRGFSVFRQSHVPALQQMDVGQQPHPSVRHLQFVRAGRAHRRLLPLWAPPGQHLYHLAQNTQQLERQQQLVAGRPLVGW